MLPIYTDHAAYQCKRGCQCPILPSYRSYIMCFIRTIYPDMYSHICITSYTVELVIYISKPYTIYWSICVYQYIYPYGMESPGYRYSVLATTLQFTALSMWDTLYVYVTGFMYTLHRGPQLATDQTFYAFSTPWFLSHFVHHGYNFRTNIKSNERALIFLH